MNYHNEEKLGIMMANGVNPCRSISSETGCSLLQYAVRRGDLKKVNFLLPYCSKTGINYTDNKGRTAFHLSINVPVYFHSLLITKALFRRQADVNIADQTGQSPLHRACILGELSFVQELLNLGAKVQLKDCCGRVPLECCKEVICVKTVPIKLLPRDCANITTRVYLRNLYPSLSTTVKDRGGI